MTARNWLIVLLLVGAGWWYSPVSPRVPPLAAPADALARPNCTLPPRVSSGGVPLQSAVPSGLSSIRLQAATLAPLAGFSVEARVLSRHDYAVGREADLSPTDLALGWQRMTEDAVLSQLEINQGGRWYHYRWRGDAPIPPQEITRSSANMHLIPADAATAQALRGVNADDRIRIDGWLVEATSADGWRWRSSTSRDDTGAGGCELIYVCSITKL
jgi:hypothetical protein